MKACQQKSVKSQVECKKCLVRSFRFFRNTVPNELSLVIIDMLFCQPLLQITFDVLVLGFLSGNNSNSPSGGWNE